GMRRRLLLAKALVHHPKILVLDEPTAGVDIELRQMLWANVRKLNEQGMTIILTTHYLEEAQEMCDQIAIIDQGEVRAIDSTANLLSSLDRKTLIIETDFTGDIKMPEGVVQSTPRPNTRMFSYSRATVSAQDILQALIVSQITINDFKTEDADLEDVFLTLTKSS
ncbi:MAG: ABC transporter ATP-binding protein, partial [Planktomarina sp.]